MCVCVCVRTCVCVCGVSQPGRPAGVSGLFFLSTSDHFCVCVVFRCPLSPEGKDLDMLSTCQRNSFSTHRNR